MYGFKKGSVARSWVPAELNIYREDITHCAGLHESLRRRTSLSSAKEHQLSQRALGLAVPLPICK